MTDRYPAGADAFARKEWAEAYRLLSASSIEELTAADLTRLAVSAYLIGEDDEAFAAWERAHRRHLDAGDSAEERLRRWVPHPEPIASGSLERNQLPRRWAGPLRPPLQGERAQWRR